MNTERSFLVLPKRYGGGWRLNWKHRMAVHFFVLQVAFIVQPLWLLRRCDASEMTMGVSLLFEMLFSAALWFWLIRNEV